MIIIVCEPNHPPSLQSVSGKYVDFGKIIGGQIKALSVNHPNIVVMCNQTLYKETQNKYGRMNIPGTFLFVGYEKGYLRSLSEEEINEVIHTIRREDFTLV